MTPAGGTWWAAYEDGTRHFVVPGGLASTTRGMPFVWSAETHRPVAAVRTDSVGLVARRLPRRVRRCNRQGHQAGLLADTAEKRSRPDGRRPTQSGEDPLAAVIHVRRGLGSAARPISLVVLTGEHDSARRDAVEHALADLNGHVLVDLTGLRSDRHLDHQRAADQARELQRAGFKLELIMPSTQVHLSRTFDLLGIRNLVTIREDRPLSM